MPPRRRQPFASVLCPVDFSVHAKAALQYAAAVANRAAGALSVLYVNDPFLVAAAAAAYDEKALASQSAEELARFITKTVGVRAGGQRIAASVALGQPAVEILKAVRRTRADLIVVGSEGLSGASRLFFGSTTARLLNGTPAPVLAVPPAVPATVKAGDWPGPRVLAAIDLGREAAADVAAAAAVARWFGARLSLVHVVEKTRIPTWLSLNRTAHDRSRMAAARVRLGRLAKSAGARGFADAHVFVGDPAEQIAALANDLGAGLVLLTLRGDDRLFGDRKGATTYRVVCNAGTPVLAVPAGWMLPTAG